MWNATDFDQLQMKGSFLLNRNIKVIRVQIVIKPQLNKLLEKSGEILKRKEMIEVSPHSPFLILFVLPQKLSVSQKHIWHINSYPVLAHQNLQGSWCTVGSIGEFRLLNQSGTHFLSAHTVYWREKYKAEWQWNAGLAVNASGIAFHYNG